MRNHWCALFLSVVLCSLVAVGCRGQRTSLGDEQDPSIGVEIGNPFGIETGNPIIQKSIRIVPEVGLYVYVASILDPAVVQVDQFAKQEAVVAGTVATATSASALVEIRTVSLVADQAGTVHIPVDFTNGEAAVFSLAIDAAGGITTLIARINNAPAAVQFEIQAQANCGSNTTNGALQLAEVSCSRIVACVPELLCQSCRDQIHQNTQLAEALGVTSDGVSMPWTQVVAGVDAGALTVEAGLLAQCLQEIVAFPCVALPPDLATNAEALAPAINALLAPGVCPAAFAK